mmetsp:Transcript_17168/g.25156  ORF Transcript_17168/g.25156 Transcript_17168/m.25156 type:complete len:203 (-) Transcript_17168:2390-2998(-)
MNGHSITSIVSSVHKYAKHIRRHASYVEFGQNIIPMWLTRKNSTIFNCCAAYTITLKGLLANKVEAVVQVAWKNSMIPVHAKHVLCTTLDVRPHIIIIGRIGNVNNCNFSCFIDFHFYIASGISPMITHKFATYAIISLYPLKVAHTLHVCTATLLRLFIRHSFTCKLAVAKCPSFLIHRTARLTSRNGVRIGTHRHIFFPC